jgi:FkbM family methyltransferase
MVAETFVSFAQNGEDVVLWRALGHVAHGTYVDVGAADPIELSVTKAFHDRGWCGLNVEPVPEFAELLRRDRPDDVTVAVAAGRAHEDGRTFYSVPGTGLSTLQRSEAQRAADGGWDIDEVVVSVRTLDEILEQAGFGGRPIHFCKIDVEGAESEVLAGFDLSRWRPWVLVVESTRPLSSEESHESWEPTVINAGYRFCLFDGVNRFYAVADRSEVARLLNAPANPLDSPYVSYREQRQQELLERTTRQLEALTELNAAGVHNELERWRQRATSMGQDTLRWREQALKLGGSLNASQNELAATQREWLAVQRELAATLATVSWRVTKPLRAVRRSLRSAPNFRGVVSWAAVRRLPAPISADGAGSRVAASGSEPMSGGPTSPQERAAGGARYVGDRGWTDEEFALASRLETVASVINGESPKSPSLDLPLAMAGFEEAVAGSSLPPPAVVWLAFVAVHARYPSEDELDRKMEVLELDGPLALARSLFDEAEAVAGMGAGSTASVRIIADGVLVDVTHTASHDLHTGIQRVVRETVSRWRDQHSLTLIAWSYETGSPSALPEDEARRFSSWRMHMHGLGGVPRSPLIGSPPVVIPWRSVVILPELAGEPLRTDRYRALLRSGVSRGLSAIGYDLIPITLKETVADGMSEVFADYLGVLKYGERIAAISESSAREFTGWAASLSGQGLTGPLVVGYPLPTEVPALDVSVIDRTRTELCLDALPMVLVVGSHEPRKNHSTVLLAAEHLWREGMAFHLVFIGGSAWKSDWFDERVSVLRETGRPVQVIRRASEEALWATCHLARFSVFPSFAEGFGLPVAESLACGTPALTSDFGSMAELAEGGGVVAVDPRDPLAVTAAMRELLLDDELIERLCNEAKSRCWRTWDEYAAETWRYLTDGDA